ncbi:MAG: L-threonylcarbamoyladenylate synthase [Solirubrobacterales bacterium]
MSEGGPTEIVSIERGAAAVARSALERVVTAGGVALFPADGLYGLACDPLNAAAISRIYRLKGRDDGKPSAVMYFSPLAMRELVSELGAFSAAAVSALLPGPVTLVIANPGRRYPLACREHPERLGVRLLDGPLAGTMCPVFQTSANLSGEPPPARLTAVPPEIVAGLELVIEGGELTGMPSTVVDISSIEDDGGWTVLREGALSTGDLASAMASVGLG